MTSPNPPFPPPEDNFTVAQLAALLALVKAQAAVREQITQTAIAAVLAAFTGFTGWWSVRAVDRAVAQVLRVVQPAQRQAARVTDAYLARAASIMLDRRISPAGITDLSRLRKVMPRQIIEDLAAERIRPGLVLLGDTVTGPADTINEPLALVVPEPPRGRPGTAASTLTQAERARVRPPPAPSKVLRGIAADPAAAYARVAEQYRYQVVAKGFSEAKAQDNALARLMIVAETDITLAVREQSRATNGKIPGTTGYRRVIHPERSASGTCGLCAVAASRVYKKEHLKEIHDRCKCETLPIIGKLDPGSIINYQDLGILYDAAGSTGGGKRQKGALKRIRVMAAEHAELGPTLIIADQPGRRGPTEVAKTQSVDRVTSVRAQLDSLDKSYAALLRRSLAGEDVDEPLRWHSNRLDDLRREMASL